MSNVKDIQKQKDSKYNLQDYLSLGYVYLLVLGVFNQAIYYKFLNINILEYSSILDVLISPISIITGDLKIAAALIFAVLLGLLYKIVLPKYYNWLSKKEKYNTGKNKEKIEKSLVGVKSNGFTFFIIGLMVFSVFIGLGTGRGSKVKNKIDNDEIKLSHEIIFQDNTSKHVTIVGKNSLNVFYVLKGKREVTIVPIEGNVKSIEKLKKE